MFNQATLDQLQKAFQKSKLKSLSRLNPKKLSLSFDGPHQAGQMAITVAKIKMEQKTIISVGFGKLPNQKRNIMFTIVPNPHHYQLATINQDFKPLKIQASLTAGQLLLITSVNQKSFFSDISKFMKANRMLIR